MRSSLMKKILTIVLLLPCGCVAAPGVAQPNVSELPPLPAAVSNNAVVAVIAGEDEYLISFAGLGEGRGHADTLAVTYVLDAKKSQWTEKEPVPGGAGRLAAVAASAGELAYVFGGYTVAADGSEVSTPWVHAFDPATGVFDARASMPVPVDDAVAVTFRDRFIYLISGWHDLGNVNLVQRYDTRMNSWSQATPTPGRGVFGHAGGIVGNTILYCDGVAIEPHADRRRDFVANKQCFAGTIDDDDTRRIDWRSLPPHPGPPRYRMAAAGIEALGSIVFVGGSDNPYNFDGIGYNGEPAEPSAGLLRYDLGTQSWSALSVVSDKTMDHRGLVGFRGAWVTVGGMLEGQRVTDRVFAYRFD